MSKSIWSRLVLKQLRQLSGLSSGHGLAGPQSYIAAGVRTPMPRFLSASARTPSRSESQQYIRDLCIDLEREKQKERNERKRLGLDTADIDAEEFEDFMGVGPLIEKLEKEKVKDEAKLNLYEERSDSDSEDEDERFTPEAERKLMDVFQKKFKRHTELIENFTSSETLDDSFKWMNKIDKFEQKHFRLRPEYRVIGELMNRMKVAEGKERFLLQQKLNRAMRMVEWKEAYDPNDPANYGVIQNDQTGVSDELLGKSGFEREKRMIQGADDDDDLEFDDMKEKDDILLEKLSEIDEKLEEKLAELDYTFGRKGKLLEEEIRDLAEERNSLTEKKRKPLYRKVELSDVSFPSLLGFLSFPNELLDATNVYYIES